MSDPSNHRRHARERRPRRCRTSALALLALSAVLLPPLVAVGAGPARADVSPYGRTLAVEGLADPEIYKVNDGLYFLSGTSSQDFLPIYTSTDLQTFTLLGRYDPNAQDSSHHYCNVWAPDLDKQGTDYVLYFVANRVAKGARCPSSNSDATIFYATAPDATTDMQFGAPHTINEDTRFPRTYVTKGCPSDGCDRAMRLDPAVYFDGSRQWMFYTWFDPGAGLVVSGYPVDAPGKVVEVTRPKTRAEQGVNEAPTLFSRDGRQYLFFSQGSFASEYRLQYFMGAQVSDLTDSQPRHSFSTPLKRHNGRLIENAGHNTVTDRNGQFYTLYHVAKFTPAGVFAGRDVYIQPLMFKADGSLNTLNTVDLQWHATAHSQYSVDVQTRDGAWILNCLDAGDASSVTFTEVCTGASDQVVHKTDVIAFRINRVESADSVQTTTLAYDGYTDTLAATA